MKAINIFKQDKMNVRGQLQSRRNSSQGPCEDEFRNSSQGPEDFFGLRYSLGVVCILFLGSMGKSLGARPLGTEQNTKLPIGGRNTYI